jgi:tagatose 6-phosphate kinase
VIVVAGLTPAWQQIMRFPVLRVGEVNRAAEVVWCASGKVLNVGLALASLGTASRTISPVGGPARETFERDFAAAGAPVDWIVTDEPTRVCTTLLDESTGVTTELVENARPLSAADLQAYGEAFRKAAAEAQIAVFTGSLPGAVSTNFYRDLAEKTTARLIVDARGPELLAMFEGTRKPFLVKPNREELGKTVRRELQTDAELFAAMRELNERGVGRRHARQRRGLGVVEARRFASPHASACGASRQPDRLRRLLLRRHRLRSSRRAGRPLLDRARHVRRDGQSPFAAPGPTRERPR